MHSPGPWEIRDGVVVSVPLDSIVMVTLKDETVPRPSHNGIVAIVYGHHVGDIAERCYTAEGNKHLIAAAPDLLEALRGMVGLIQLVQSCEPALVTNHSFIAALAAIAKANAA